MKSEFEHITVGFIGCGTMGSTILRALCTILNPKQISVSSKHFEHAQNLAAETGCTAVKTNSEVAAQADYLFLAVKPAVVPEVLSEIARIENKPVIISMAAGITLASLKTAGMANACIRIMPNMPAKVGEAMTALCADPMVRAEECALVTRLLAPTGRIEQVDEKLMDCVTAVSGSGPAYVFMFIEALADAAVRFGMPRKQAYIYAAQTVKGSAAMVLEDSRCPAELKDAVCSPAGTTIEGVAALERTGFRNSVIEAVSAACTRSAALGKK
jgi:pyrroline-5-carboxylate reductase